MLAEMSKLKELELIFAEPVDLTKNHFVGLENLQRLKIEKILYDTGPFSRYKFENKDVHQISWYHFSFEGLENLESFTTKITVSAR